MSRTMAILILVFAASLEAGGDALMRADLHAPSSLRLGLLYAIAAMVLFAYGWCVNTPPWDFGKLLGLYVVFFFLFAQLISWIFFKQPPSLAILIGDTLIVAGGIVISWATSSRGWIQCCMHHRQCWCATRRTSRIIATKTKPQSNITIDSI